MVFDRVYIYIGIDHPASYAPNVERYGFMLMDMSSWCQCGFIRFCVVMAIVLAVI